MTCVGMHTKRGCNQMRLSMLLKIYPGLKIVTIARQTSEANIPDVLADYSTSRGILKAVKEVVDLTPDNGPIDIHLDYFELYGDHYRYF